MVIRDGTGTVPYDDMLPGFVGAGPRARPLIRKKTHAKIEFPTSSTYDIANRDGCEMILDPLRQKYVVLTPEEWVRQNFVRYLIEGLGLPAGTHRNRNRICISGHAVSRRCTRI